MADAVATTWEQLRTEALGCTRCPLAAGRTQVVFGVGDPGANLLFVGEGPGQGTGGVMGPPVGLGALTTTRGTLGPMPQRTS